MKRLWELNKGDKFVFLHEDGTVSESPWYFLGSDGMYCKVAKRQNATMQELKYVVASAPVKVVETADGALKESIMKSGNFIKK